MDVLIMHYHLNPGGVSTVIEAQINALLSSSAVPGMKVLCGNSSLSSIKGIEIRQDCLLDYSDTDLTLTSLTDNAAAITSLVRSCIGDHSILHCHNPNLGKNPALTAALYRLASGGIPVINHCHDFAEDRPANLTLLERTVPALTSASLQQVLYPSFPHYHFVVLNSCDLERVRNQDIDPSRVHLLPNPVSPGNDFVGKDIEQLKNRIYSKLALDPQKKLCTYPVRAIRRKNIGEFALLAALFGGTVNFALTLAPRNPAELPQYNRWKSFCAEQRIPIRWEAGDTIHYGELIYISDFCITTSIREGFGMAFLEPWLAGTPVIGRELTCVISDLKKKGVQFPRLYTRIEVQHADGECDFKDLTQDEQEEIIRDVMNHSESRRDLLRRNPFLTGLFDPILPGIISANQRIIRQRFSIDEYGKEILGIYRKVSH